MGNLTKGLINAFNLNNYFSDKINTNFTVEGKKIVGLFASSTNIGEYLRRIGEKIIKRHYLSGTEVAGAFYNLNCFPFVLGANADKEDLGNGIVKVKLADSTDPAVIHNLKINFANEFERAVISKVVARLQKAGVTEEEAYKWIRGTVKTGAIGSPYLYCIAFSDGYLYDSETFEIVKAMYIEEFNSRLKECHVKSSDFYEYKDDMLYIKDVSDKVVKSVTKYVKGRVALDFRTPGSVESKVENCKNVLSELILEATGKYVEGYDYDTFTDENKIKNGHNFALIPFIEMDDGQYETLNFNDAGKINRVFNKEIPNGFTNSNFISDIRGKTANPQFANCKEPVYAFSNKQIALLLPMIMESPIAYNERNGRFEFAVDLRSQQFVFPTPPPTPVPNGPNSSLTGLSSPTQEFPTRSHGEELGRSPRQGTETEKEIVLHNSVSLAGTSIGFWPSTQLNSIAVSQRTGKCVSAAQNVRAGTSQPIGFWSSPTPSAEPSLWQPSRPLSRKGANESGSAWTSQPIGFWSSPTPSAEPSLWQPSRPLSRKGASESGSAGTSQPIGFWSSPPPAHENKWMPSMQFTKPGPSGLSWTQSSSGPLSSSPPPAHENKWMPSMQFTKPGPSCSFWQKPSQVSSFMVNESSSSGCKISNELPPSNKLNNKEKELIEALLYTLNLTNYTLGGAYTNFFAKDGKIVSLLHDNVDREKYFQAVRAYIIEEYCGTEEEARKVYDLDEFPFKLNCEEKQGKTVVANISRGALSNLKILFSQKFGKNVDAIDISAVKKVEKREKDEWVDRQRSYGASLQDACESCFPDEGPMKIIPIALEGDEYVLDRSREECEVELLLREQSRRFRPLTEEEKELFKELLYAFNYSNNNFDLPDTNFIVKNGKIASLIPDSVNVKEYLKEVRDKTKEEYCKDKKEAYDLNEFPFKFLSNCEKNQETTVVANISRGALFNLKKLFIYGYKKKAETGDIDINTVEEAVKSKKDELVNSKVKGIEREGGYYSRIKPDEAVTGSYPDKSALEDIPIGKYKAGYRLNCTYGPWETESLLEEPKYAEDKSKAKKMKSEDNKDRDISLGEATDAENVSSKAEGRTSDYYSMSEHTDHEESSPMQQQNSSQNTGGGSPKRKSPEPLAGSSTTKKTRSESDSSSFEGGVGLPHPDLSGSTLEQVRKQLSKTGISK